MTDRFRRQRRFDPVGDAGQERLAGSRVAIIGCGALGTHAAQSLVRAGVGHVDIYDRDFVELDNLPRQVLFDLGDATEQTPKALAAAAHLRKVDPAITVEPHVIDVDAREISKVLEQVDVVVDGTDNFETRYLLNDACVRAGVPWVYAGVVGGHGMVMPIVTKPADAPPTACLRCAIPDPPPPGSTGTCDTVGVIGPAVGVVSGIQCAEVMKILVGAHRDITRGLVTIDTWRGDYRVIGLSREPNCPCCAKGEYPFLSAGQGTRTSVLCGRNAVQISPEHSTALDFAELDARWRKDGTVRYNEHLIRFQTGDLEMTLFRDGRAVIKGTEEAARARSFYSKYVGG